MSLTQTRHTEAANLKFRLRWAIESACVAAEASIERIRSSGETVAEKEALLPVADLVELQSVIEQLRRQITDEEAPAKPGAGERRESRGEEAPAESRNSR